MPPKISVLLPTFSRFQGGFLKRAVASIQNQTFRDWELFVVDDASFDGTANFLAQLSESDKRINHFRMEENVGLPAQTLAKAFLKTSGDFIAFNFDDTELNLDSLQLLYDKFAEQPELEMVYGDMLMHMPDGVQKFGEPPNLDKLEALNFIGNASVLIKKEAFRKIGWYDPNLILKRCCDWDLWLRAFKKLKIAYIPTVLSEEFGQAQTDSFRRCLYMFESLLRKYMLSERDEILTPEAIATNEISIDTPCENLNDQDLYEYAQVCLEHFIRTMQTKGIAKHSATLLKLEKDPSIGRINQKIDAQIANNPGTNTTDLATGLIFHHFNKMNLLMQNILELESALETTRQVLGQELGNLKDEHHKLLRSASWKLTYPLRKIRATLGLHRD